MASKWEVTDSYGKVVHTASSLYRAGLWIDPLLGINFRGPYRDDDEWRVTRVRPGVYEVQMYQGAGGMGGTLTITKVSP